MAENRKNTDQFQLRLPPGLRDRIKLVAERNSRSTNAEIIATLEREYPEPKDVMHVHLQNIRIALNTYERSSDPQTRMRLQTLVEAMVTLGDSLQIDLQDIIEP